MALGAAGAVNGSGIIGGGGRSTGGGSGGSGGGSCGPGGSSGGSGGGTGEYFTTLHMVQMTTKSEKGNILIPYYYYA